MLGEDCRSGMSKEVGLSTGLEGTEEVVVKNEEFLDFFFKVLGGVFSVLESEMVVNDEPEAELGRKMLKLFRRRRSARSAMAAGGRSIRIMCGGKRQGYWPSNGPLLCKSVKNRRYPKLWWKD